VIVHSRCGTHHPATVESVGHEGDTSRILGGCRFVLANVQDPRKRG
jgi:hypothetical protein